MFDSLLDIEYAIPIIDRQKFSRNYRTVPVNRDDPRFCEPLVPLESYNVAYEGYYAREDGNNPPYCHCLDGSNTDGWLRKSVSEKLARVNEALRPFGAELLILDAYRSVKCQQSMWNFHYGNAQQKMPDACEADWQKYAKTYASPPVPFDPLDSKTWLPHMSGAAADLTLRDLTSGELLDMGSNFEEITEISCTDYFERKLARGSISNDDRTLYNRRLLHWAMGQEDFINDPLVYWHYDWGNQLYIIDRKIELQEAPEFAWYGYIAHSSSGKR